MGFWAIGGGISFAVFAASVTVGFWTIFTAPSLKEGYVGMSFGWLAIAVFCALKVKGIL